jgi:hypothetical protein
MKLFTDNYNNSYITIIINQMIILTRLENNNTNFINFKTLIILDFHLAWGIFTLFGWGNPNWMELSYYSYSNFGWN